MPFRGFPLTGHRLTVSNRPDEIHSNILGLNVRPRCLRTRFKMHTLDTEDPQRVGARRDILDERVVTKH